MPTNPEAECSHRYVWTKLVWAGCQVWTCPDCGKYGRKKTLLKRFIPIWADGAFWIPESRSSSDGYSDKSLKLPDGKTDWDFICGVSKRIPEGVAQPTTFPYEMAGEYPNPVREEAVRRSVGERADSFPERQTESG